MLAQLTIVLFSLCVFSASLLYPVSSLTFIHLSFSLPRMLAARATVGNGSIQAELTRSAAAARLRSPETDTAQRKTRNGRGTRNQMQQLHIRKCR